MTKTFTSCFKTLASLLVALMCCWNITYAQVTSFPTTENFDGETICENEAFAPADNGDCPLIGTWSQDDGDDFDFSVETDATPSGSTGPSADHTGGGNFLFCETSGAGASSTFIIEGNDDGYDVSALSCPFVEVWYHAFGLSVVSGQVHLEASSDGGTTYTSIASVIGPDSEDTWKLLQGNLSSFAGATVHLRIRVFTGTSFDSDIGIDDVSVFDNPTPPTDLALSGLSSSAGCNASTSETITVSATNNSCSDIAAGDAEATIEVNGGGEITEALPAIPAGATVTYTFTATFDFSIPNTYTVDANVDFTAASGIVDDTPANNGVIGAALSISEFFGNIDANNPAYVESFEADNGGWVTVDVNGNTTMDLGTPPAGQTNINAASDGTMAWFSGGSATSPVTTGEFYNANELVFFQTGCFDMSCMETATFSIDVNWDSETNFDGLTIGFNTDGGTTFSILGIDDGADTGTSDGTGVNWYNSTIGAIGVPGWTGDCDDPADAQCSGGFVTATHDISFLAGASNVRFAVIFASDGSVQDGEGAAWDNVSITGDTTNPSCVGCTDANAANFSASAVYDDGNCLFPGCTDATACNFDSAANDDDGSCAFGTCGDGNCDTACGETAANCADCANTVLGCTDATACNFDVAANSDDGSCEFTSCVGCTDATACNFNSTATTDDGSCEFTSCVGCTNAAACNFDAAATIDDGSCVVGSCGDGVCDAICGETTANCSDCTLILGCTDPAAHNFRPRANSDNGTCITCTDGVQNGTETGIDCGGTNPNCPDCDNPFPGCTDSDAHNFDPNAVTEDGSCTTCTDGIQNGDETGVDCGGTNANCGPCGDLCTNAIAIECGDSVIGDTNNNTADDLPANCGGVTGPAEGAWYKFEGVGGNVELSTDNPGTSFDTNIQIFSGDCNNLTCVGGNEDIDPNVTFNFQSEFAFNSVLGTDYYIYVSGWNGNQGVYELSMDCIAPLDIVLAGITRVQPGTSSGAVDVTITGGCDPLTFAWTGPGAYTADTEDISGLGTAGNYTLTVTDCLGNTETLTVNVPRGGIRNRGRGRGKADITDVAQLMATPNPFVSETTISFQIEAEESVSLDVFDIRGAKVATLFNGMAEAGQNYQVSFGEAMPSGTYIAKLTTANGDVQHIKLVLTK